MIDPKVKDSLYKLSDDFYIAAKHGIVEKRIELHLTVSKPPKLLLRMAEELRILLDSASIND